MAGASLGLQLSWWGARYEGLSCRGRVRKPGGVLNRKALGLGPCRGESTAVRGKRPLKFSAFLEPKKASIAAGRFEGGARYMGGAYITRS